MVELIQISDRISYIKSSDNPLSADVILVDGRDYLYVFDVGNHEPVAAYLNSLPKKKRIILSHFHTDHMGNIGRVQWETVFFGANTEKYFQHYIPDYAAQRFAELPSALTGALAGEADEEVQKLSRYVTVFDSVKLSDGVTIEIHHVPNSHAKGSLLLQVNEDYIFMGDALYPKAEGECRVYNAQLLKEEIELLKRLPGQYVFSDHEERPIKSKAAVLRFLEQIYEKRNKNEAYIRVSGK